VELLSRKKRAHFLLVYLHLHILKESLPYVIGRLRKDQRLAPRRLPCQGRRYRNFKTTPYKYYNQISFIPILKDSNDPNIKIETNSTSLHSIRAQRPVNFEPQRSLLRSHAKHSHHILSPGALAPTTPHPRRADHAITR